MSSKVSGSYLNQFNSQLSSIDFNEKIQKITFIAIVIITCLIGLSLLTSAILLDIPLLCVTWIPLFSIVLASLFILSSFYIKKKVAVIEESNITKTFTENTKLSQLGSQINNQTSLEDAQEILKKLQENALRKVFLCNKKTTEKLLKKLENDLSLKKKLITEECKKNKEEENPLKIKKTLNILKKNGEAIIKKIASFSPVSFIKGSFEFPLTNREESTAIVCFTDTPSSHSLNEKVSNASWKSATNQFLKESQISSGFFEYISPIDQQDFSFVKLLIQAKAINNPKISIQKVIKSLKATYLNIFLICEKEGIKVVQIPTNGFQSISKMLPICEKIALLEAFNSFSFDSLKTILLVEEDIYSKVLQNILI